MLCQGRSQLAACLLNKSAQFVMNMHSLDLHATSPNACSAKELLHVLVSFLGSIQIVSFASSCIILLTPLDIISIGSTLLEFVLGANSASIVINLETNTPMTLIEEIGSVRSNNSIDDAARNRPAISALFPVVRSLCLRLSSLVIRKKSNNVSGETSSAILSFTVDALRMISI